MKNTVCKLAGIALLAIGVGSACLAAAVPEIDVSTGANALALVTGALLIVRSRRK